MSKSEIRISKYETNSNDQKSKFKTIWLGGSHFKIFKGSYTYSFFQDDRFDFGVSFGLFVIPIDYDFKSTTGQQEEVDSITAPLPVIGLKGDFAITPKLFLKSYIDLFYLEFDDYVGKIWNYHIALEYNVFKNVGFGVGFDHLEVDVEAHSDTDIPGVNFNGNINFLYTGVMIYTKIYFWDLYPGFGDVSSLAKDRRYAMKKNEASRNERPTLRFPRGCWLVDIHRIGRNIGS